MARAHKGIGAVLLSMGLMGCVDDGGPRILGQLLLTPVTDSDMKTASYLENAEGYVLTAPLMRWWNAVRARDRVQ